MTPPALPALPASRRRPGPAALWLGLAALWLGGAASRAAEPPAGSRPPGGHARYTFGTLGGKRGMAQGSAHVYYLTPEKELCVVEKPAAVLEAAVPSPAPVGKLKLEGVPEAVEWVDDRTLCVGTGNHLALVDVSDPAQPRLLAELQVAAKETSGVSDLRRSGSSLYAAARLQGLLRVDVAEPARPRTAGAVPLPGWALGVDVQDDLIAVATGVGISLVRVAGDTLKVEVSHDTLRRAEAVRFQGSRLVFLSKEYAVFWDLSDPRRPVELAEISNLDPFFHTHNVALHAFPDRVYVASTEGGLHVHDWKDPRAPRLAVQFSYWGNKHRLSHERKLKYLEAHGLSGTPDELARYLPSAENILICAVGLAVDGDRAYLADYLGRLWAVEVQLAPEPSARCVMRPD